MRRTKILATLGPASDNEAVLRKMIQAGLNAVRCNFSHGTKEDHEKRIAMVRKLAKEEKVTVGILADLQGPKIRISTFKSGKVTLKEGQDFILDINLAEKAGDQQQVGVDYKALPEDVKANDLLLLDDGRLVFEVLSVTKTKVKCNVLVGGILSNNKGINKKGGGLSTAALTEKDKEDILTAAKLNVDYIAVSFPKSAKDMVLARKLVNKAGSNADLVAKIERVEALDNLDEIIATSDAVMVARGDLSVEIGSAEVPASQKTILKKAREYEKIGITATQMMESMITSPTPTRAEVSDVANAVLDGTDVVMLSAETATGAYPVEVIQAMDRICRAAEKYRGVRSLKNLSSMQLERVDDAIAIVSMIIANHVEIKAIIALTESGHTARLMSRVRSHQSIFALTRNKAAMQKMTLFRGVCPICFDSTRMPKAYVNRAAVDELLERGEVQEGDLVLLTSGDHMGVMGGTNKMKIVQAGKVV